MSLKTADQFLLAGTGRRCTNPPPNIAHGGWGAQKHERAEGIDMDLWTTALALSDGATTAIILDLDIQILTDQRADEIRAAVSKTTKVPVANIRAAATHTHSGPVPYKSWVEQGYELVQPWFEKVAALCAEAAAEAIANLHPCEVRMGRGECHINANRRAATPTGERFLGINPDGPCDREVLVIRFDPVRETANSTSSNPIATLVNYACHPTVMGPLNRLITPDYPGASKRVVEQGLGGKCIFLQGSAGDQGPVQGFQADITVYRDLGAVLGHEILKVAIGSKSIPSKPEFQAIIPSGAPLGKYDAGFPSMKGLPLKVIDTQIPVPLREGLPEKNTAQEKLDFWSKKLKAAREANDSAAITEATYMARRADIQLRMADDFGGRTKAGVRGHFITFGDFALVGCNIEPFCEIGMAVKKQSPFEGTFMCGYTNGRMAYMPTAEEWSKGGYEVENSPFGQGAAETLVKEIGQTLKAMATG